MFSFAFFLFIPLFVESTVYKNGFLSCKQFFDKGFIPTGYFPGGIEICQDQNKALSSLYATYYDTARKIPTYSAYTLDLSPGTCSRPGWYQDSDLRKAKKGQAKDTDYTNSGFQRGHLSPNCYYKPSERSVTFALTNAVPQEAAFNGQKAWGKAEGKIKDMMKNYCSGTGKDRYFITGAIPGKKTIGASKVNVPSYMYTAACCRAGTNSFSIGYYGDNTPTGKIVSIDVVSLGKKIQSLYSPKLKAPIKFFSDDCNAKKSSTKQNEFWRLFSLKRPRPGK